MHATCAGGRQLANRPRPAASNALRRLREGPGDDELVTPRRLGVCRRPEPFDSGLPYRESHAKLRRHALRSEFRLRHGPGDTFVLAMADAKPARDILSRAPQDPGAGAPRGVYPPAAADYARFLASCSKAEEVCRCGDRLFSDRGGAVLRWENGEMQRRDDARHVRLCAICQRAVRVTSCETRPPVRAVALSLTRLLRVRATLRGEFLGRPIFGSWREPQL
jgi:hypothetical protein